MKDNTLKLSGHSKDRFLERFFAEEAGLDPDAAKRLVARGKATFTSLRVRKIAVYPARKPAKVAVQVQPRAATRPASTVPPSSASPAEALPPAPSSAAFDAYAFGLVPTFQREGRAGLIGKLEAVGNVDHLRQMAKAQQIVLPKELRSGNVALDVVRGAIADAVAKRIADRKAAAG